jgi:hypothetical protein
MHDEKDAATRDEERDDDSERDCDGAGAADADTVLAVVDGESRDTATTAVPSNGLHRREMEELLAAAAAVAVAPPWPWAVPRPPHRRPVVVAWGIRRCEAGTVVVPPPPPPPPLLALPFRSSSLETVMVMVEEAVAMERGVP